MPELAHEVVERQNAPSQLAVALCVALLLDVNGPSARAQAQVEYHIRYTVVGVRFHRPHRQIEGVHLAAERRARPVLKGPLLGDAERVDEAALATDWLQLGHAE